MAKFNKVKGRQPSGSFYWIPRKVHRSADFRYLNPHALKLLVSLAFQFKGKNNGDLTAAWTVMSEQHGFKSRDTLNKSRKELLATNLIHLTRQGGRGRCSLFALTWMPIDECPGKMLEARATRIPIRTVWDQEKVTAPKTNRMKRSVMVKLAGHKKRVQR